MNYEEFLKGKVKQAESSGINIDWSTLNKNLFDFQGWTVKTGLIKGRYAIWADCGLGKTLMQLEWAYQISLYTGMPVLILAPLAVTEQTIAEGLKFGIDVEELKADVFGPGIYITNYEQLDHVDASQFVGVVLDESSILKNFEGATKNLIIEKFQFTKYKLACSATPAPNDAMELGNHAEFLGYMTRSEMLAMYFVHDGGDTGKWRIKGHAVDRFYQFVSTWACMISNPSDIGFDGSKYVLPPLNYVEKQIDTTTKEGLLFNAISVSATDFNAELRLTKVARMDEVAEIVNSSTESFIVWIKHNEEGDLLKKLIPDAVEVRGNHPIEQKKANLLGFGQGKFRVLITKAKIAQYGLNYQNCHNQVFASLDFSFESFYQQIRRSYRFGQTKSVNLYIITTDTMANVIESIKNKQKQFEIMQQSMQKNINECFAHEVEAALNAGVSKIENEHYTWVHGDSCKAILDIPDESIGHSVFSPPFADLYTYSDSIEDMGNSRNYDEFVQHFSFLIPQLFRVMQSGRNVSVHCMDLPIQKGKEGYIGLRDFSGMIREVFEAAGFIYHSRVCIWKNPVTEMQRTKALGLLHKQLGKDAAMSRVGIPDNLLVFRKPGEAKNPVKLKISVDTWQKWASPVWMDIDYSKTLNGTAARSEEDEKHICPLQLETIERSIALWSNEGDKVLTLFGGVASEPWQAVKMNRYGYGIELKRKYWEIGAKNLASIVEQKKQTDLFNTTA